MPAEVVVVTTEPGFAEDVATRLEAAGHESVALMDSMTALSELEHPRKIELLITCAEFPSGQATGLSLARMGRFRRPQLKVVFIGPPEYEQYTAGFGLFMQSPVTAAEVAEKAIELLDASRHGRRP
jgi:DNA-binding response OmpR family regulator